MGQKGRVLFGDRAPPSVAAKNINARLAAPEQFARTSFVDRGTRFGPQLNSLFPADAASVGCISAWLIFNVRELDRDGFWSMTHARRTHYAMLLGAIYVLLAGGSRWSLDSLRSRRDAHSAF